MCTAIIEVPESAEGAVRLLAVRDEDPGRAWDEPGRWWPESPDLIGVRDRLAGGAWLAAAPAAQRLALVLNRAESADRGLPETSNPAKSRGKLVLDEAAARVIPDPPGTANFNMVTISGATARITSWDGISVSKADLDPGVHMIAHHDVNDASQTPRIARWLPEFRELAGLPDDVWRQRWISLLDETARLPADDDRAIIRDNRSHGYETLSLLVCLAEVRAASLGARGVRHARSAPGMLWLDSARLTEAAKWDRPEFESFKG